MQPLSGWKASWREVSRPAAAALGVSGLSRPEDLGGSKRTRVWRCSDGTSTVVVKAYREPDNTNRFREPAGLVALSGVPVVPRVLATVDDPPVVVMADLGGGPSLADLVLGRDRGAAAAGVESWATAVAALHAAATPAVRDRFTQELARRGGDEEAHADVEAASFATAATTYEVLCSRLGLDPRGALDDLAALGVSLGVSPGVSAGPSPGRSPGSSRNGPLVLSPNDTCPDNNVIGPDGAMTLFDFEGATVRHPAWDLAYLRVPWPTCWCAWALPPEVSAAGVARYRTLAPTPWASSPTFEEDLDAATLAWCLVSPSWFLETALSRNRAATGNRRMPGRRTMVLSRLALAQTLPAPDSLHDFAGRLHAVLVARWGEHPLALAPAFA